jgi:hypothetical protein
MGSFRPDPHNTVAADAPSAVWSQARFNEANKKFCIILPLSLRHSACASWLNKLTQVLSVFSTLFLKDEDIKMFDAFNSNVRKS